MGEGEVRMQAKMYALVAEMQSAEIEAQGMVAENNARFSLGQSMAYTADAFFPICDRMEKIAKRLREEI